MNFYHPTISAVEKHVDRACPVAEQEAMNDVLVMASSSFGRSSLFFPEICSTSTSGRERCLSNRTNGRKHKFRRKIRCLYSLERFGNVLFRELEVSFGRGDHVCSAMTSGNFDFPLSDKSESPQNFRLQAEVRKRRKELEEMQEAEDYDNADDTSIPFWKRKPPILPFWRRLKLQSCGLTNRVMELSKRKKLDEVFALLGSAKMVNRKVNRKTMNAVLEACVHCGDIRRTMQVFNSMAQPGACGVDEIAYGTLIKGLGQGGMLDKAFEVIESMESGTAPCNPRLSIIHLNTLINACANAGDARRARAALVRYRSVIKNTGPSLITYNMLIKGYARSENPLEALKVREEMQLRGLQPNKLTLNSLILACVRGQDMHMAFDILEEMKEAGVETDLAPDVVTYTTLIKGLAGNGDLEGVLNMVAEMKTMALDRVGYTAIIDACIVAGSPEDGLKFLQEMEALANEDRQMKPRAHAFLALMRAFSERGDVESVASLRSRMVLGSSGHVWAEDRLEADELLIEAAVNDGQLSLGKQVLSHIVGLKKRLQMSQRGYLAVVRLQVMTNFSDNLLSPCIIRDEVSLNAPLQSILPSLTTLKPLSSARKLADVIMCFFKENAFPVVDEYGRCVGTVHSEDCFKMDSLLTDVMRDPPSVIQSSVSITTAVNTLLQPDVNMIAVTSSENGCEFLTKDIVFNFLSRTPG